MPDVPERCWYCERELAIESIRVECAHCGADVGRAYEWLDAIAAARAEAERWRKRYEALMAGVEHVLQLIAREERNEGFLEPDLEEIRRMLTAALGEAGGVSQ